MCLDLSGYAFPTRIPVHVSAKKEGGVKEQLIIRRFHCKNCHSYHSELPDCLVPYKHYETEVISGVLDGIVQPDDLDSEDYPSFTTMLRWLQWFRENHERINGYLRTIREFLLGVITKKSLASVSLLDSFRNQYQNWLEIILRQIYNSGGFLSRSAGKAYAPTLHRLSQYQRV